ncbi:MAG TPA: hypothetical protein DCL61_22395 [Cyanobacteria bacterium UBA12227]|nr:hypothetical protein [Cyanobacteria bacterium UBA12227]HBY75698.1 hypothetical protein [Cyanobacteria bacterium UBA11148]
MVEYSIEQKLPFVLIDTDRTNPDVLEVYRDKCPAYKCFFSENEQNVDSADPILYRAMEGNHVIVNLPSQIYTFVTEWFERTGVLSEEFATVLLESTEVESELTSEAATGEVLEEESELQEQSEMEVLGEVEQSKEEPELTDDSNSEQSPTTQFDGKIEFYKWFVCTGQPDSVDLFVQSLADWGDKIPHILVKNEYWTKDFSVLETKSVKNLIKKYRVEEIALPKMVLSEKERQFFAANKMTFSDAIAGKKWQKEWRILSRQRVATYFKQAKSILSQLGLLNNPAISEF